MFFSLLFDKYYEQISSALLPGYKKAVGKVYLKDIQSALEAIKKSGFQVAIDKLQNLSHSFQERYKVSFKPLALPQDSIKDSIKTEVEPEWSGFFKTVSVLIDNHDFYKAIENRFQRRYQGIVKAAEVLAKDVKLIADIQQVYSEAENFGKSREKLIHNVRYLAGKSQQIFSQYYEQIALLRDEIDNYSEQTIQKLTQAKKKLAIQIEQLIAQEQSIQSEYEQFFLGYRLLITQRIDPIYDSLKTFSFRSQELRSQFIERLAKLEDKHPEKLELLRRELDEQFESLLNEVEQMQAVEQADKEARESIKKLGKSTNLDFFQEVAEEAQQTAIRSIGDSIRELEAFPLMLQKIESIKQGHHNRIHELTEVESQYLNLRNETIRSIDADVKFSISSLNLNVNKINELFVPETSYRLVTSQLNSYDMDANQAVLNQMTTDGMLLSIGELGDSKREPVKIEHELNIENLSEQLSRKISELGISNMVGLVPVFIDELERLDIPAILFFCRDPEKARPELTCLLEVVQQGKLIYIRKLINIFPLPSQVLNDLLDAYKAAFRLNLRKVTQLISDEFLANKLKLDFQGSMAQTMTKAKQNLRNAYLEELRQDTLSMVINNSLERNVFLKTIDNLIIESLDAWLGFEASDEPLLW
ncbi:MAG: hypothetical protein F6K41_06330 [Symploca sp. SIO3E6]|nr:hypothetical protein [Caldora sp. SIO3E6]